VQLQTRPGVRIHVPDVRLALRKGESRIQVHDHYSQSRSLQGEDRLLRTWYSALPQGMPSSFVHLGYGDRLKLGLRNDGSDLAYGKAQSGRETVVIRRVRQKDLPSSSVLGGVTRKHNVACN
jgi:hypothetical protein